VENLPIVVTATSSRTPVLDGAWLSPGALVCAIGSNWLDKTELDATAVERAGQIICDSVEACRREAGDLAAAESQQVFQWSQAQELADVVAGAIGRGSPDEIVLFKSVGLAIEDVALGAKALELAREKNVGQWLPP
jgi:ornithine cyclodeaminase/alanine dehydrogenase-like protein (mu-crystallin family)